MPREYAGEITRINTEIKTNELVQQLEKGNQSRRSQRVSIK